MASTFLLKRNTSQGTTPTTGQLVAGELAINAFDGKIFVRGNNGADFIKEIGALAQRGLLWDGVSGLAPLESYEFDAKVYSFTQGLTQSIVALVHVPASYVIGSPIKLRVGHYTSGVANNFKFQSLTTLIRKGVDAVNSTTNQFTSTNGDQAIPATQYQYLEVVYDLSSSLGKINSIAISPNDLIKITFQRITPTGTEDANDVRLVIGSSEIQFA